eukprot:TRINITY_DN5681_c0_g1_i2.p1 TRINITY_DN5681_c0_g1~~TRINITY_DN5681_c0_g1_i2.p1  ORF type:complete len:338 (-),score=40.67 TRINITY_DN5681_c0_g1_i2:194-1186(-)
MVEWDSLLAYATTRIVKIRDKRLGLLYYFFLFVIFLYIVGWTLLYQKRYLHLENPVGSIRLSLLAPEHRPIPEKRSPASQIPYCLQNSTTYRNFSNYNCTYWDEMFVTFPVTEDHDMLIATRYTSISQSLHNNCSLLDHECEYVDDSPAETFYIADIEKFTLMVEHTMYAPSMNKVRNGEDLSGELLDCRGQVVPMPYPNSLGKDNSSTGDVFEISKLLSAACVDLDDLSDAPPRYQSKSKRDLGIVLIAFITYSNTFSFNYNNFKYTYRVQWVKDTKFKSEQPIYTKSLDKRVVWDRHGIRIIVLQTGMLGKFDFQVLLLTVQSSWFQV